MSVVGRVESVWRYPVKSLRGEELPEIFAGFAGVYGDRIFAFKSSAARAAFPYWTARDRHEMLLYRPRFRHPQKAAKPANLAEAEEISPLLNPVVANPADLALDVETPSGELLAIDDPALLRQLGASADDRHSLTLLRSDRAMTDCRPISFFSLQTVRQLGEELGSVLDKRRFRANVYLDLRAAGWLFRERPRRPQDTPRIQSHRVGRRARPALPDDHPRSGDRGAEPGSPTQCRARSRSHGRRLWRRGGGRGYPGRRRCRSAGLRPPYTPSPKRRARKSSTSAAQRSGKASQMLCGAPS